MKVGVKYPTREVPGDPATIRPRPVLVRSWRHWPVPLMELREHLRNTRLCVEQQLTAAEEKVTLKLAASTRLGQQAPVARPPGC